MATDAINENAPPEVNRAEYRLLQISAAVLEDAPLSPNIQALIANKADDLECLSPTAMGLLQDQLSKGIVRFFARRGWQSETYLRDEEIARGSVWERTPPNQLGLTFGEGTIRFLMDLGAKNLSGITSWRRLPSLTLGDRVFILLCVRAMNTSIRGMKPWTAKAVINDGLIALMYPDRIAETATPEPDFAPWLEGAGAALFECLQEELSDRWIELERSKEAIVLKDQMLQLGQTQQRVAEALISSANQKQRWDLCRFLLATIEHIVASNSTAQQWIGHLNMGSIRLSDRSDTYRAATCLLHLFRQLEKWNATSQGIGYFDENYQQAQLWKSFWEQHESAEKYVRSQEVLRELQF